MLPTVVYQYVLFFCHYIGLVTVNGAVDVVLYVHGGSDCNVGAIQSVPSNAVCKCTGVNDILLFWLCTVQVCESTLRICSCTVGALICVHILGAVDVALYVDGRLIEM